MEQYNRPEFIPGDPISIPHRFTRRPDIEIAGFFAAVFSWGNRKTIIQKTAELMALMDEAPHAFILGHDEKDLQSLLAFRHRTFHTTDLLYFIEFFKYHYTRYESLEDAFIPGLAHFYDYFFSLEHVPTRTRKHVSTPAKKSACKRLNMFLRWMVRRDDRGVDFGLWDRISPATLICPLDLHVARVARRLGLLTRKQNDWQAALDLTGQLRKMDKDDPVKYDFALFGLGIMEKFS